MASLRQKALDFMESFNSGDLDRIMSGFANDCRFLDPQGQSHEGKDAVRAALAAIMDSGASEARYEITDTFVDDAGSAATICWTLRISTADGAKVCMYGVDVLKFNGDGVEVKNCYMKAETLLVEALAPG